MINVSDAALTQLQSMIAEQAEAKPLSLRVFVESGGCSGYSYRMGLDENPPRDDDEISEFGGVKVVVDPFSAQYLEGAEIDWIDQMMGGGFTIHNPNAVRTCGCGHSFQTADGSGEAGSCH